MTSSDAIEAIGCDALQPLQLSGKFTDSEKSELRNDLMPEGHSAMDKALTCNAGGRGLNLDMTKDF